MKQVYLPVAVTLNDDGTLAEAIVDFEGQPFLFVDETDNVWFVDDDDPNDEGKWISEKDFEAAASLALERVTNPRLGVVREAPLGGDIRGSI